MNVIELNVKDYIRRQTKNTAFKANKAVFYIHERKCNIQNSLIFNDIYKLYNDFKKLGKQLFLNQDRTINKIKIQDNNISVKWPLIKSLTLSEQENNYLTNFLTSKYSFNNNDIGLNLISLNDIVNFSELVYLCSDSIKSFAEALFSYDESDLNKAEDKFKRIINIYQNGIEQAFQKSDLRIIPEIIHYIDTTNPQLSQIVEELSVKELLGEELLSDDHYTITPWLNYTNILSVFFHFFKLEIVYYSHIIVEETKKPKLCPICNKYVTEKCTCMTISESYRRNINKKNERLRKKLVLYLNTYRGIIPMDLERRADKMIEQANEDIKHWEDYPELKYLCDNIKIIIKEASKY